jgi:hypothetical protein
MERYLHQLITDIDDAAAFINSSTKQSNVELHDWLGDEEEDQTAPVKFLPDFTGITSEMLPPAHMLTDTELQQLLTVLNKLLDACNLHFVLQIAVPERIQYETMRANWNQHFKLKSWHMGFFEMCEAGTTHLSCSLGEFCQCAFYEELCSRFVDEDLSPEEERARALETEVKHIKRKYGADWMKYYPYHLDKNYDDENGNPHDYDFGNEGDDDDWWKK